jgi:acyl-CoA dehydrogenase
MRDYTVEHSDPEVGVEVAERVQRFMDDVVLPVERAWPSGDAVSQDVVDELRAAASEYDVSTPLAPTAHGGLGLDLRAATPVVETASRSLLGPPALRLNSPDQANIQLLDRVGTPSQCGRWLAPLVEADIDSAVSMTEPLPGSGSDPAQMQTTATRDGDHWVIDGHKWWTALVA